MNIEVIGASLFDANCYVLWTDGSSRALVVDPGPGTAGKVRDFLKAEGLRASAVLLTHGHVDHVWDAAEVADGVPVYIPAADRYWLTDPLLGLQMRAEALGLGSWHEPGNVHDLGAQTQQLVPGITVRVVPAPGHSPGSSLFLVATDSGTPPLALSGDVVFAGSVGRTDLPGGDEWVMRESLRTLADALDPQTVLLPGHGPATTWRAELDSNPFVRRARRRDHS